MRYNSYEAVGGSIVASKHFKYDTTTLTSSVLLYTEIKALLGGSKGALNRKRADSTNRNRLGSFNDVLTSNFNRPSLLDT